MRDQIKKLLSALPLAAELNWALRGRHKPWNAHYRLESLREVLPGAVQDAQTHRRTAEKPRKICVFATLHYWIEQSGLVALALAGCGHELQLAYLPYAEWDREISPFDLRTQDLYTRDCFKAAEALMKIVPLLGEKGGDEGDFSAHLDDIATRVADYDTQYTLQIEHSDLNSPLYRLRYARNRRAASVLYAWLQREKPDLLIVPNGTILEMGVAYRVAQLLGIHTVTFEFADQRERIWLAQDDEIMSHDTTALWQAFGGQPLPPLAQKALDELYAARRNAKTWQGFARQWQQTAAQGGEQVRKELGLDSRPVALLATNVLGDSLTLGRQKISATMADWIVETIRYFVEHPEAQLLIRIHPGELKTHGTAMMDVIRASFESLPEHIHIVAPGDKTNTYDLMEVADLGLVYTTTVGMEMAMSGLPVLTAGKTHYACKGFTIDADSWQDYLARLGAVLANPRAFRLTEEQRQQAWLYAYCFFFEFSLPFPWHLLWLGEDFEERPLAKVLSDEGMARYGSTLGYLAGEQLDWRTRGLARLKEMEGENTYAG